MRLVFAKLGFRLARLHPLAVCADRTPERHARLIRIPRFNDDRGTLCVVDWAGMLPFTPDRLYYIYDLAESAERAGHAHFRGDELILALAGGMSVVVDNGHAREEFRLDHPDTGLYIPAMVWHQLQGFGPGAVCAVLASGRYSEEDYCRDYQQFLEHATSPLRPLS
jgi:UDP-2-acetamido-3-amino-2,3-dideoxy-glucuronate N-acetyltransferase